MATTKKLLIALLALTFIGTSCKKKIKVQQDEVYSRHLQAHVKLTIINTPMPDDKGDMNLLLVNDGQDIEKFRMAETIDSLWGKKAIAPVLVVAIETPKREDWYGVAGYPDYEQRGSKADKYAAFIDNELYAYIKKKAGVRKFNSVVIAGASLGGLSAMDIAWNNADKIDKVGVFSGSFWWRDIDATNPAYTDAANRIMLKQIQSSRKRPHLKYWLYAGMQEEKGDRDKDGLIDVADDTKDLADIITKKNVCPPGDIVYIQSATGRHDYESWSGELPKFLLWAFGR